jgi:nucleotide-binding universal stress UspA family protein
MKILFPTDFSNAAENAFVYALKLADLLQARITVLHVYAELQVHSWVEGATNMGSINDQITLGEFEQFKNEIRNLKRLAVENNLTHVEINYSLKESDNVIQAVIDDARESNAELIVIGTRGASGLKEIFFGSVASKVMEFSTCPVVMVPDSALWKGIEKTGLALEYKEGELELIEKALAITRRFGGHLHCLHVDTLDPVELKVKLLEYKKAFEHEADISFHVQSDLDVENGILEFMKFNQIDVVIMRMRRMNILQELFTYSISKRVAYHSDIPLIGVHTD